MAEGNKRPRDEPLPGSGSREPPNNPPLVRRTPPPLPPLPPPPPPPQVHMRTTAADSYAASRAQDRRSVLHRPSQRTIAPRRYTLHDSDTVQFSWLFYDETLRLLTPSRTNEMSLEVEMSDRDQGVSLIISMAHQFQPNSGAFQDGSSIVSIISKASYLFHRFYMVHCLTEYHIHLIACSSLSLILKLNGVYSRKIVSVYKNTLREQAHAHQYHQSGKVSLDNISDDLEEEITRAVYSCELVVLKAVFFNVDIPSYPYRRVKDFFEKYFSGKQDSLEFYSRAKKISVDCLRTSAVLIAPVDEIAVACLQLANNTDYSKDFDDTICHIVESLGLNLKAIDYARKYTSRFYEHHRSYFEGLYSNTMMFLFIHPFEDLKILLNNSQI